jgi:hypothetical protein
MNQQAHFYCVVINTHRILVGKPEGKRQLEDIGIDWKIILEWIINQ